MSPAETAIRYHVETKHHFDRFARSAGFLDWANQPDPFRRYRTAALFELPIVAADDSPPYPAIYDPAGLPARRVEVATLSELLYRSLALSAWKEVAGTRWSLRCNPSSGNLHPTEGYLLAGPVAGLAGGPALYHYAPAEHGLELRCELGPELWQELTAELPPGSFLAGLTSVHWRETWKYGERAYRYCQHDVGHGLAAVSLAAASLGWRVRVLDGLGDDEVASLLGLDRDADFAGAEREHPDLVAVVFPAATRAPIPRRLPATAITGLRDPSRPHAWDGRANRLSPEHVAWEGITAVEAACTKPADLGRDLPALPAHRAGGPGRKTAGTDGRTAREIFRQRRSAVAMDGRTSISATAFARMLGRVLPDPAVPPWDAWPYDPALHLALFVHRVDGLPPGIYLLPRSAAGAGSEADLRAAMRTDFLWEDPPGWTPAVPLRLLAPIDCRDLATRLSCDQEIAGAGAFSLGMVADFEGRLRSRGAWFYRRLFWEAGMIGQVLYLEAEAAGLRATGIGCFYDDPVHHVLGLDDLAYQSVYHFTTGAAVDDPRLRTHEAYAAARRTAASPNPGPGPSLTRS